MIDDATRRRTDDEEGGFLTSGTQPLLLADGDDGAGTDPHESPPSASRIRSNFLHMSTLFAINHGCSVSCLGLANARLGAVGVWQSGALYASYTAAALFGASYVVTRLGSQNGLALGMAMTAAYVTSFFLASLTAGRLRTVAAIAGALVGGVGSSVLWVSQGSYFACASRLFASVEGEAPGDVTSRFGGDFAFIFLTFEVILRLLSTFLIETAGMSWRVIFGVYALQSILPAIFVMQVVDVEKHQSLQEESNDDDGDEGSSPLRKATAALDLLRRDPKTKYLSPVNVLFGLSTAFGMSVINGEVIQKVLSDPNSTFVGLYTAVTSMVAALASLAFGRLLSSREGRPRCGTFGKEGVLSVGASSYLAIASAFLAFPDGDDWNRATLLGVYVLLGVGRATYEGTLRAAFADFFPNDKEGAFANIILWSGTASTLGYVLSVSGALRCEEVSKYCMEYSDGSIHNILFMELTIIFTALIAIPSLWRAVWMFRKDQSDQNS